MLTLYIVIALYFLVLVGIGVAASRQVSDYRDYYVAGKKLGYWVVAFSARATGESAWLLLGLTGLGAMVGVSALWVVVGEVFGVAIAWFAMAKPFKDATDRFDSITVPDYLASRFSMDADVTGLSPTDTQEGSRTNVGSRTSGRDPAQLLRILAAGALAIFVTIYVSAQIDATGKAFESFLGWSYYWGIAVGFGLVVAYTMSGGFFAVAWSDLFQGSLMLLGLVGVPFFAWLAMPAGANLLGALAAHDPGLVNPWGSGGLTLTNVLVLISYLTVGLGFLGSPQIFVRFMSIRDLGEIERGRWVAVAYTLLTDTGAVLTGMLGRYLLVHPEQDPESVLGVAAEGVLPAVTEFLFPAIIVGLITAAVLAAIMSTIDSLLVVASSAVTRDFHQQIMHPDRKDRPYRVMSRVVTLVLAVIALGVALAASFLAPGRTVFWFVIFGWSGIAATFCPAIILSLFWKRYTVHGAIASMCAGFLGVPLFRLILPNLPDIGHYFDSLGEMAPSFALALVVGVAVSVLTSTDKSIRTVSTNEDGLTTMI